LSDNGIQRERCLDSLIADGLVEPLAHDRFRLPASREAS
jgi:A/G-specific adenine glycosylase